MAQQVQTVTVLVLTVGLATSFAWVVIGWRAMSVLERIADAVEAGAFTPR